jgi:hypothetical protein
MVKPAISKDPKDEPIDAKTVKADAALSAELPEGVDNVTGDPVKPDPTSGHSADPDFYKDQFDLYRWRVLGGGGEVITSADQGFPTKEESLADFKEADKSGRLMRLIEFQGKSGSGFTTTGDRAGAANSEFADEAEAKSNADAKAAADEAKGRSKK